MLRNLLLVVAVASSLGIANSLDTNLPPHRIDKYFSDLLKLHNAYRKAVDKNLPNLKWDSNLAAFASKTVIKCSS